MFGTWDCVVHVMEDMWKIIKLMICKGANDWGRLENIENLELYKLYTEKTGQFNRKHYRKLVCFYDPVYVILTQKKNSKTLKRFPTDLIRLLRTFI